MRCAEKKESDLEMAERDTASTADGPGRATESRLTPSSPSLLCWWVEGDGSKSQWDSRPQCEFMMSTPGASYARAERLERHMKGRKYRPSLARRGEGDGSSCCWRRNCWRLRGRWNHSSAGGGEARIMRHEVCFIFSMLLLKPRDHVQKNYINKTMLWGNIWQCNASFQLLSSY